MAGGYNRRAHATIRMDPFGDCLIGDAPGSDCSGFIDALGLRVSSMLWVFGFHRCFGSSGFIDALVLRVSSVLWVFGFHRCYGSSGFIGALGLRVSSMLWFYGFHRCFGSLGGSVLACEWTEF